MQEDRMKSWKDNIYFVLVEHILSAGQGWQSGNWRWFTGYVRRWL